MLELLQSNQSSRLPQNWLNHNYSLQRHTQSRIQLEELERRRYRPQDPREVSRRLLRQDHRYQISNQTRPTSPQNQLCLSRYRYKEFRIGNFPNYNRTHYRLNRQYHTREYYEDQKDKMLELLLLPGPRLGKQKYIQLQEKESDEKHLKK